MNPTQYLLLTLAAVAALGGVVLFFCLGGARGAIRPWAAALCGALVALAVLCAVLSLVL